MPSIVDVRPLLFKTVQKQNLIFPRQEHNQVFTADQYFFVPKGNPEEKQESSSIE